MIHAVPASRWLSIVALALAVAATLPAGATAAPPTVTPVALPAWNTLDEGQDVARLLRAAPPAGLGLPVDSPPSVPSEETPAALASTADGGDWGNGAEGEVAGNRLLDNLSIFGGIDGSRGPEDLGINANFGGRAAVNWGLPLLEEYGLGVQLGTAINYSRTAVRVLRMIDGTRSRTQSFTTVGLFQRTALGWNWGVAYDFLSERYYAGLDLGQWRGQVSYLVGDNEYGVWGILRDRGDHAAVAGQAFNLQSIPQANLFWRHYWPNQIVTRFWAGVAEGHGRFVFVAPGTPPIHHPFVYGADLFVPLTDHLALFGEANFLTPNDTGTVSATLGFAFYPGGGARAAPRNRFAPMLPLANNPSFPVDLRQ